MLTVRNSDQRIARLERELDAARRISQTLSQHIHVDEVVAKALLTALEVVGAEAGSVLLADPDSKQLVFRHVVGEKAEQLRGMSIPCDQGIAGAVFTSGLPDVTSDVRQDRRHLARVDASTGYTTRDMITLPLKRWEGKPIGVLQVLNKRGGRLGEDDLSILTIISALAAAAIEQASLFEQTKLAEMVRLLGDISHDIRNLLAPVVLGVSVLYSNLDGFFDGEPRTEKEKVQATREVIAMLQDATQRIQDRMKEISDCVKGLSAPPRFASCHLAQVVLSVLGTLRFVAEQKGISIRIEDLDSLPALMADERRLYVAIYNLVNNAIPEVAPGGSITIRGRAEPAAGVVLLSIIDTGRGMPPEVRDSLFTVRAISRKVGGTGLGTKIVKDVVESHGGQITVESEEGRGSTFHIRLPLYPPQPGQTSFPTPRSGS